MAATIVNVLMDNGTGTNVKLYYIASQTGSFTAEPKRFDLTASLITAFGLSPDDYEPGDGYTLNRLEFIFSGEDKDAGYIKIKDKVKAVAPDAKFSDNGKTWTELQSAEPPPPPPVTQTEQSAPDPVPAASTPEPENINNVAETKPIEEKRAEAQKDMKPQAKIGIDGYASSPVVYDITHFNNPDGTYKSMVSKGYDVVLTDRIFAEIQNKDNIAKTESKAGWTVTPDEIVVTIVDENVEAAYTEIKSKLLEKWPLKFTKDKYLGEVVSDVPESKSAPRETNNNTSDTDATINKNKLIDSSAISDEGKKNILEVAKKEKKLVEKAKPSKEVIETSFTKDCDDGSVSITSDKPVIGPASEEELQYQYSDEEVSQDYYNTADNVNNPSVSGSTSAADNGGEYYEDMVVEDDNYGAYQPVSEPGTYSPTSSSDGSGSLLSNPDAKSVNISSDGKSSLGGVTLNAATMKSTLQKLNYKWYDKGINIIGIRAKSIVRNKYNDKIIVVWYENGQEKFKSYPMTTYPGETYLKKPIKPNNACAIMKPGQFINAYNLGFHQSRQNHPALVERLFIPFYRDMTKDGLPHITGPTVQEVTKGDSIGMNIHGAWYNKTATRVDDCSAGCQVFQVWSHKDEFLIICEKFREQTGNKFTYTLIRQEDIVVPQVQASTGNSSSGLWG